MKFIKKSLYLFQLFLVMFMGQHNVYAESEQAQSSFQQKQPVMLEELADMRGQGGVIDITTVNNANLEATLTGNSAINNVSGFNIIDHGAFTEASGMVSVIQNTGNNVVIQDSTIINFTITP